LAEMLRASNTSVALNLDALPILEGAQITVQQGILSSLHSQNLRSCQLIANLDIARTHAYYPLLFDPQTSGGLLASLPSDRANDCLAALRAARLEAAIVGQVLGQSASPFIEVSQS
jgi:selenide, water dikinase